MKVVGDRMKRFVEGVDREQGTLFPECLEDWIVDERLFFAGEATIHGAQGTCHGAYVSGIRAAREIAESLRE